MLAMRQNLATEDITPVTYGCASHHLNTLGKNVTINSVMANIIKIQIFFFFLNHNIPGSLLRKHAELIKP